MAYNRLFFCAGLLSLTAIGCGKEEEIKVYTAPKDHPRSVTLAAAETDRSGNAPSTPAKPNVSWKTPEGWKELAPTSMRVGNFSVAKGDEKAEIAILPFPGSVGGELENVNRWRGEIGLEAVKEGGFTAEPVEIGADRGKLYDLQGPKLSTVAAMLERDGTSWFFKMRGDKELVAATKPTFVQFLKTITFESRTTQAELVATPKEASKAENQSADDQGPQWEIPKHWKPGPQKPMVLKNWDIADDNKKTANLAISSFPGEVGGIVANVNRWRGQLNLPALTADEVKTTVKLIDTNDGQASVVDFKGTDRTGTASRLVAAIVPHAGDTWFYKLTGDEALVEREKAAFLKLVQTANYR